LPDFWQMNPLIECIKHQEDTGFDPAQRFLGPALWSEDLSRLAPDRGYHLQRRVANAVRPQGPFRAAFSGVT
jgi:hypothetical protein